MGGSLVKLVSTNVGSDRTGTFTSVELVPVVSVNDFNIPMYSLFVSSVTLRF